jgi:hypothetical protein
LGVKPTRLPAERQGPPSLGILGRTGSSSTAKGKPAVVIDPVTAKLAEKHETRHELRVPSGLGRSKVRALAFRIAKRLAENVGNTARHIVNVVTSTLTAAIAVARQYGLHKHAVELMGVWEGLVEVDWEAVEGGTYSPGFDHVGDVSVETAGRGLGRAGCMEIDRELWDKVVGDNLPENLPDPPLGRGKVNAGVMVDKLLEEGHLKVCTGKPNATIHLRPKTLLKCCLIANPKTVNLNMKLRPPKFKRPNLQRLAKKLLRGMRGVGCTLDVSNCYWSLRLPEGIEPFIRVGNGKGLVLEYLCLTFGWSYSPVLCQETLKVFQVVGEVGGVCWIFHYLDDFFIVGRVCDTDAVRAATRRMRLAMQARGLVVSDKSVEEPTDNIKWLGKWFDLTIGAISNDDALTRRLFALLLKGAVKTVGVKYVQRMIGTALWAYSPKYGALPFLQGWHRLARRGHLAAPIGKTLVKTMVHVLVMGAKRWKTRDKIRDVSREERIYVDAAEDAPQGDSGEAYYVGLVRRDLTCLRVKCPAWVTSQQQGEAYGMEVGLRDLLKVRSGKRMVLVGDNIGQVWNAHKSRAPPTSRSLGRIMRRQYHIAQRLRCDVNLAWIPGGLNPADIPSRTNKFGFNAQATQIRVWEAMDMVYDNPSGITYWPMLQLKHE